ncbi:MAG: hypothetical protein QUU85_08620 [Candidatus Eisenbacteria bacterium]|nr:hypothetical protein [Candidatus Eisenbacteria bacterium]
MLKIDLYLQQIIKHGATAIELVSNRPVRYKMPDGDRDTAKAMDHAQLTAVLQEAAPPEAINELRTTRKTRFRRRTDDGMDFQVEVDASAPTEWVVRLTRVGAPIAMGAPGAAIPMGAPGAAIPMGAAAPARAPLARVR